MKQNNEFSFQTETFDRQRQIGIVAAFFGNC